MNKNLLIATGVFLAVVVVGIFLIGNYRKTSSPSATTTPGVVPSQAAGETDVQEISITADEYSFTPPELNLNPGSKVRLTLINNGRMTHDLAIEELNVRTNVVSSGERDTVEFTVPEDGELTYYCSVSNHRALGMEGKITIE